MRAKHILNRLPFASKVKIVVRPWFLSSWYIDIFLVLC